MPTYDYRCGCGHVTEVRGIKYEDRDEPQKCEDCGGMDTKRAPVVPFERKMRLDNHPRNKNQNIKEY